MEYKEEIEKALENQQQKINDRINSNEVANHGDYYTIALTPMEHSVLKSERTSIFDNPVVSATDTSLTLDVSTEAKRDHALELLTGLDFASTKRNTKEFKSAADSLYNKVANVWDGNVAPD